MTSKSFYQPQYEGEPDWQLSEEVLFQFCADSIERFVQEQENRLCSALCLEAEPTEGYVWISFETPEHDCEEAEAIQEHIQGHRAQHLQGPEAWKQVTQYLQTESVPLYTPGPEDYAFALYSELDLDRWSDFANIGLASEAYLNARAVLVFWQVLERLIERQELQELNLAYPFRLGYCIHGQNYVNLRVLRES